MASLGKKTFKGESGEPYRFKVYALGTKLRKLGGVYVITNRSCDQDGGYRHATLYVGETEDFSQPFERHHKAKDFLKHGANCICLQMDVSEQSRVAKQQDLVAKFHPVCND
ncbi:MAG: hypothetical protein GXY83_28285 [Rhodopirellula sp.]|nr:hypothetical protein [Rhodopirellula sp.]